MIERPREDDPRLAAYRQVGDHRWLRERGLFVAEGRLVVARLLLLPAYRVESIVVSPAAFEALRPQLAQLACDVFICDRTLIQGLTGFNFHRGCLALVRRPEPHPVEAFLSAARLVALEGVGNPDNVGGIFRTAAALGADGVVLDPTSGDPLYRKAIRTSMGAALQLPWLRLDSWLEGLARLRSAGFMLVALTPDAGAAPLHQFAAATPATARMVLLLGAEGSGLTPPVRELADARVRIPIESGVDSLNVVVAASIALERLR